MARCGTEDIRTDRRHSPSRSFCSSRCQHPCTEGHLAGVPGTGRCPWSGVQGGSGSSPQPPPHLPHDQHAGTLEGRQGSVSGPGPWTQVSVGGIFPPKTRGAGAAHPATRPIKDRRAGKPRWSGPEPPAAVRGRGGPIALPAGPSLCRPARPSSPPPAPPPPPRFRPWLSAGRGRAGGRGAGLTIPEQRLITAVSRGRALTCPR